MYFRFYLEIKNPTFHKNFRIFFRLNFVCSLGSNKNEWITIVVPDTCPMSIVNAKQQQQHSVEITKFYSHNFLQEFCEINFVIRRITMVISITKCFSRMRMKFCFFHTVQVQQMGLTLSANIYFDQIGIQHLLLYIFTANCVISIKTNFRCNFLNVLT